MALDKESDVQDVRDTPIREPVQLRSKARNRFYEPVVLLAALTHICTQQRLSEVIDPSPVVRQSSESLFHDFVNKISQICDSKKCGGTTVTAFVILQHGGSQPIEYRFASNQRNAAQLKETKDFVTRVLNTLQQSEKVDSGNRSRSEVLHQILVYNRSRVIAYLTSLGTKCDECMSRLSRDDEDMPLLEGLQALRQALQSGEQSAKHDDNSYFEVCDVVALTVRNLLESETGFLIRIHANEGRMNQRDCWCDLQHAATRFLSYYRAVETLYMARRLWPELFDDFKVTYVLSSLSWKNALRKSNGPQGLTAHDIVGRMTSDREKQDKHRVDAQQLQVVGLDDKIREQARNLNPIVHAEVLIHQSLEENDLTWDPSKFFNSYKYIGSSKPTCRLCKYYFDVHDSDVKVRLSHGNLYSNWRVPDVYGPEAASDLEKIMTKMLESIRGEGFRTLSQKVSRRKPHDSNSDRTYPTFHLTETYGPDELNFAFNRLQIAGHSDHDASAAGLPDLLEATSTPEVDDTDHDHEVGGASLL